MLVRRITRPARTGQGNQQCHVNNVVVSIRPSKNIRGYSTTNNKFMNLQDLRKSPLFEGLSDEELQQLVDNAVHSTFRAGDVLMQQGDPGNTAHIVLSGAKR